RFTELSSNSAHRGSTAAAKHHLPGRDRNQLIVRSAPPRTIRKINRPATRTLTPRPAPPPASRRVNRRAGATPDLTSGQGACGLPAAAAAAAAASADAEGGC